jgi:hypothetical protein
MYEPSTIQCRVLLDCKEKIASMQQDLCKLGTETKDICTDLNIIFQKLETMHEEHRLALKSK